MLSDYKQQDSSSDHDSKSESFLSNVKEIESPKIDLLTAKSNKVNLNTPNTIRRFTKIVRSMLQL